MRQTVRAVARLFPTAIISGRGRDKVYSFVQLQELFYAGSHGLDIVGPVVSPKTPLKVEETQTEPHKKQEQKQNASAVYSCVQLQELV